MNRHDRVTGTGNGWAVSYTLAPVSTMGALTLVWTVKLVGKLIRRATRTVPGPTGK